jgi:hypothetical protein
VVLVGILLAIGFWHPARAMEITDKDRQTKWATQAEIEGTDVDEMVEGQNVYRRERGEADITRADAERSAAESQRASLDRARESEQPSESPDG